MFTEAIQVLYLAEGHDGSVPPGNDSCELPYRGVSSNICAMHSVVLEILHFRLPFSPKGGSKLLVITSAVLQKE